MKSNGSTIRKSLAQSITVWNKQLPSRPQHLGYSKPEVLVKVNENLLTNPLT